MGAKYQPKPGPDDDDGPDEGLDDGYHYDKLARCTGAEASARLLELLRQHHGHDDPSGIRADLVDLKPPAPRLPRFLEREKAL